MNGPSTVNLPDSHSDYECFVSDIRKDFELRVETVQRTAEENTRAYEEYCGELKSQLQQSITHNKQLEEYCTQLEKQLAQSQAEIRRLEDEVTGKKDMERKSEATELLSTMACVDVTHIEREKDNIVYTCVVEDGKIKGHKFSLSLKQSEGEYTYKPLSPVSFSTGNFDLNSTVGFPDYMISRFLANLLDITQS